VGKPIRIIHRTNTGPLRASGIRELASGTEKAFTTRFTAKDGHEVPVDVHARRISTPDYEFIQWIARDISERVQFEELQNDLFSMIYHDLRSPLANVISSLDVLDTLLPEEGRTQRTLLEIATHSTERIQRLVSSLLDIRRLESGQPIVNRQSTSVHTLVKNTIENVLPTVNGKNQEIKTLIPDLLPEVWIDEDMIRRVIINLLENAVKYTPAASKIYLGAAKEKKKILMWVQDTGPGIAPGERERIFDKFTRLHGSGGPKGYGLGLAFCKLAIEAHGGQIWVEDGPVSGACFKFTLPAWEDKPDQ